MVEYERLDGTMAALADPTRRAILRRLAEGPARVTEIAAPFPLSLNAVSKHIRVLEQAGLVERRRRGREHILSLQPRPLDQAWAWLDEKRRTWSWRLAELERVLKERDR